MTLHQNVQQFRVHLAIKATISSVICAIISIIFHLDYGFLSPLVTVLMLTLFHGQTIRANVIGFLTIIASGLVAIIISVALHEAPFAYVMCMLAWIYIWMVFLTPLPLGHLLGGILTTMILFTVVLGTGRPEDLLLAFWTQVFIAIAIASAFDYLFWPTAAQDSFYKTLAALFEDFSVDLEALATESRATDVVDRASMAELSHIAHLANCSAGRSNADTRAEFELKLRGRLIWDRFAGLRRHIRSLDFAARHDAFAEDVRSIATKLAGLYRELADDAFHQRRADLSESDVRRRIEAEIASIDSMRYQPSAATDETLGRATLGRYLRFALSDYVALATAYNAVLDNRSGATPELPKHRSSAWVSLSWPSPSRLKQNAKLVLAVFILLVGVLYLDFPGSVLVAFYGIAFGLTANIGQLYMKGKLGALGVIGGLIYGTIGVFIVVQTPHFFVLMAIFALGMFIAVYLSSGEESVAAFGLQAALVIPFVLLVFEGPEWTLEKGITRAAALVVSAAVALLVQRLVWPVDPLVLFRTEVVKALDDIGLIWQRLWANAERAPSKASKAAKVPTESLVLAFGHGTDLLKDSRYVIGSNHPVARTYMNTLNSLEQIFSETQLLARLLQQSKSNPLLDDAVASLNEHRETVAHGLGTVSDCFRGRADVSQLLALRTQLTNLRGSPGHQSMIADSKIAASLEDRRQISLLIQTIHEITLSLEAIVDDAMTVGDHLAQTGIWHRFLRNDRSSGDGSQNRTSDVPRRIHSDTALNQ